MADREERKQAAITAVEELLAQYQDVLAPDIDLPVLIHWVLVAAHDSAIDPSIGGVYRLNKRFQSSYCSAGLMQMAQDEYRQLGTDDD